MRRRLKACSARRRSRASDEVSKPAWATSRQLWPKPAARAIHRMTCRSRRPPGDSLQLGSSA
ncbi:Uncharacterised protein [Bordetella pertussis]|nr:Uncharacterised protein [Bordetella pertussis]